MKLRAKLLGLESGGKAIVILNKEDAEELGIASSARVKLIFMNKELTAVANITTKIVDSGEIGVYEEIREKLNVKENEEIEVEVAKFPRSIQTIKNKLRGRKIEFDEALELVKDVVEGNLTEIEIASFVTALHEKGLDLDEAANLTLAMMKTGKELKLKKRPIVDKHSIGGALGDKTTLLLVPIIACSGLTIPKTSSRAITSPAGSADRAECLMPVDLTIEEMKKVVEKTNGCIVWGGKLDLAPADDIFIKIEYPLGIDPLLFPSIMAKKKAVGATHLVIDIPCGRGTKVKTIGDAELLAKDFIELGKKLGIKTRCAITYGEQPIGYAIGPALEAREALEVLMSKKFVPDLVDKVIDICRILLEMVGRKDGEKIAERALKSGKAEKKMREIIACQGGNEKIKPDEIEIGGFNFDVKSDSNGILLWLSNPSLVEIARAAGSPKDKGAGILLYKKTGESVRKGEKIFTIFAEKERKLERAIKLLEEEKTFGIGKRMEMLIREIKELPLHKKTFILER
jgi:AMP phosphorylase